ncbi:hypothetical protein [Mucisphaera sp.]|uniref:hypothetical protein n=1 Tax=Mucisphaera sp. TaxID=2913024 RepID=UPI003D13DE3B
MNEHPGPVSACRFRLSVFLAQAFERARGPLPLWEAYAGAMHRRASLSLEARHQEQLRAEAWARRRACELNDELRRPQRVAVRIPVDLADWYHERMVTPTPCDLALVVPFLTEGVAVSPLGEAHSPKLLDAVADMHRWLDNQGFAHCVARIYADEGITEEALDLSVAAPIEPDINRLW